MKKIDLPFDTVYIAPFTFKVIHDPTRLAQAGGAAMLDRDACTIYVDLAKDPTMLMDDILHELLHAGYGQTPLYKNDEAASEKEENVVAALSPRVLTLIRDNPTFIRWLITKGDT